MHILIAIAAALLLAQPAAETSEKQTAPEVAAPTAPTYEEAPPATKALMRREHENYIRLPDGRIFDRRNQVARDQLIKDRMRRRKAGPMSESVYYWSLDPSPETVAYGLTEDPDRDVEPPPMWWSPAESVAADDILPRASAEIDQLLGAGEALGRAWSISTRYSTTWHFTNLPDGLVDGATIKGPLLLLRHPEPYRYESIFSGPSTVPSFALYIAADLEVLTPEELFNAIRDGKAEISRWTKQIDRYRTDEGERRTRITWERTATEVRLAREPAP